MFKIRTKKFKITAGILIGVLVISTAGGIFYFNKNTKAQVKQAMKSQSATAQLGDISNTIVGTGTLTLDDASSQTIPSGIEIDEVLVSSGDQVKKGDTIATVNKASVLKAIEEAQEAIEELDKEISEVQDEEDTTKTIKSSVSGRVKVIYAKSNKEVEDIMAKKGALMILSLDGKMAVDLKTEKLTKDDTVKVKLSSGEKVTGTVEKVSGSTCTITLTDKGNSYQEKVTILDSNNNNLGTGKLYIHQPLEITGTSGTISSVKVSKNQKVSSGTKLLTITGNGNDTKYQQLLAQREDYSKALKELITLSKNLKITANQAGTIQSVNLSTSSSSSNSNDTTANVSKTAYKTTNESQESTTESKIESKKLSFQIKTSGKTTANTLVIESPKTDNKPVEQITAADASYTASIKWNLNEATAGYVFTSDSINKIKVGVVSDVNVSDDGGTLSFTITYPKTSENIEEESTQETTTQAPQVKESEQTKETQQVQQTQQIQQTQQVQQTQSVQKTSTTETTSAAKTTSTESSATSTTETSSSSTYSSTQVEAFTISSDKNMVLAVSVDELDINSVELGQEAVVTLDAIEDEEFTGKVTSIGNTASTSGGVSKYTVNLTIAKDDKMKQGMNASATITIDSKENVVTIPMNAIQEKGSKVFVYTKQDSNGNLSGEQEVTTGLSNGTTVEITKGLSAGDTVYYNKTGNTSSSNSKSQDGFDSKGGNGGPNGDGQGMPSGGGQGGMPNMQR